MKVKILPRTPQIYRFCDMNGELVDPSVRDNKLQWGWCSLQELWALLRRRKFVVDPAPHKILSSHHLHMDDEIRLQRQLWVAILGEEVRFEKLTLENFGSLLTVDPTNLFIPAGWAEGVVRQRQECHALLLRVFGRDQASS